MSYVVEGIAPFENNYGEFIGLGQSLLFTQILDAENKNRASTGRPPISTQEEADEAVAIHVFAQNWLSDELPEKVTRHI